MSSDDQRSQSRVRLGQFGRPHGVRGDVVVHSDCEPPDAIGALGPLSDERGARTYELKVLRATGKGLVCSVAGVDNRDAAQALTNKPIFARRDQLPEPDDDEVYQVDLVGCRVTLVDGAELGAVVAVQNFGAGDLLEVRVPGGQRTEFYPFDPPFVVSVDLDARAITLDIAPDDDADVDADEHEDDAAQARPTGGST